MLEARIVPSSLMLIIGSVQAFFLSGLVFLRLKSDSSFQRRQAMAMAGGLLVILAIALMEQWLDTTRYFLYLPQLLFVTNPLNLMVGPLLLGLVWAEAAPERFALRRRHLLHAVPMLVALLAIWLLVSTFSAETKLDIYFGNGSASLPAENPFWYAIGVIVVIFARLPLVELSILTYTIFALRLAYKHRTNLGDPRHTLFAVNRNGLFGMLLVMLSVGIALLFSYLWFDIANRDSTALLNSVLTTIGFALFAVAYLVMLQGSDEPSPEAHAMIAPVAKYQKSGLSEAQLANIAQAVRDFMQGERPYLDPAFRLLDLANGINESTNRTSQALNDFIGLSFTELINHYRIEEAQRRLSDPQNNALVLTIALDSGFNSKATFYAAFKKVTGTTPTQYKKAQLAAASVQ